MLHVLVVYAHLLATCLALGSILASDLRLITRLRDPGFRLAPPAPFVAGLITASLVVLVITGGVLIVLGMQQRADYGSNPKLQAKLVLVAALVVNAMVLHRSTFPWLARGKRLQVFSARVVFGVATPVAASLALWLYVAFLGIARPWNYTMSASFVLAVGAALVAACWLATMVIVDVAARLQRERRASRRALRAAHKAAILAKAAVGPPDAHRIAAEAMARARRAADRIANAMEASVDPVLQARPRDAVVEMVAGGSSSH